ncbi:MAG: hypothetical protein QM723_13850 [Myxococcaceae bacterium]
MSRRRRFLLALSGFVLALALGALTWPTLRLDAASWAVNARSAAAEKPLGFTVKAELPSGWVPLMRTDMHEAWKPLGLDGFNYFTFGAPDSLFARYASREDPQALRYQAWFGIYVVPHPPVAQRTSLTFADHLLSNDQRQWLTTMGDPAPFTETNRGMPAEKVHVDGRDVDVYFGAVKTHSDWSLKTDVKPARWLGHREDFDWNGAVDAFHPLDLEGFVAWWYDDKRDCFFAIYGNGASFKTARGAEVNTFKQLKPELMKMAGSVQIVAQ